MAESFVLEPEPARAPELAEDPEPLSVKTKLTLV